MNVNLNVKRYDPNERAPHYQTYTIDVPEAATVLDALIEVRETKDETLALRCSCRSSICGSCAMRINGRARLACKTKAIDMAPAGEPITVEPAGNMPVLKDLIVDFEVFWDKIKAIKPWLQTEGAPPEREYIVPNEAMLNLNTTVACIMCGACVSDCLSLEADTNFLGPAALAKAYRYVGDPRDAHKEERLRELCGAGGIWDCTHCFNCVEVCPKEVAPMDWIIELRREAEAAGNINYNGVRHSKVFAESVKESAWLDEGRLALDSFGGIGDKLAMVPVGLRAMMKGKMPKTGPFHYKRPGAEHVHRLFEELEHKDLKGIKLDTLDAE